MCEPLGFESWAFNQKRTAMAYVEPLTTEGYNSGYLKAKPGTSRFDQPPNTSQQPLRYVSDVYAPVATTKFIPLNRNTEYNTNYLKAKPGIYKLDPKITPWTREGALKELHASAGELPAENEKQTLEEKLQYLIEADPTNTNMWTQYLTDIQNIKLHAEKYPMDENMKDRFQSIQLAVLNRFDGAQSLNAGNRSPFGPINVPKAMITAIQGLNNPSAAEIAQAVRFSIGDNATADEITEPIVLAIRALRNPTAEQIANAITTALANPPSGLALVPQAPVPNVPDPDIIVGEYGRSNLPPATAPVMIPPTLTVSGRDLNAIMDNNAVGNRSPQNVTTPIWQVVANKIDPKHGHKKKGDVVQFVLTNYREDAAQVFLRQILDGTVTSTTAKDDYKYL